MDSEKELAKLLIFNGIPENFLVWKTRFVSYLENKKITTDYDTLGDENRRKNKNSLNREIIMHLDDKTLQTVISLDTTDGEEVWNYLQVTYGKIENSQILAIWEEFLGFKVEPGETLLTFLNRLDVTIYKLQSAKEVVSENLKLAVVLKGLPKGYELFKAAVHFQTITYKELKDKVIEKSLSQVTVKLEPTEFAAKTSFNKRFDYKKKQFHANNQASSSFQQKFKCSNCGRLNHRTNECFAPGEAKFKQKAVNFSGFATHHILSTSENNWKMENSKFIIDSGCTSHILCCDKYFTNITGPETDLTVSNGDLSNQKVCGIGTARYHLLIRMDNWLI